MDWKSSTRHVLVKIGDTWIAPGEIAALQPASNGRTLVTFRGTPKTALLGIPPDDVIRALKREDRGH